MCLLDLGVIARGATALGAQASLRRIGSTSDGLWWLNRAGLHGERSLGSLKDFHPRRRMLEPIIPDSLASIWLAIWVDESHRRIRIRADSDTFDWITVFVDLEPALDCIK